MLVPLAAMSTFGAFSLIYPVDFLRMVRFSFARTVVFLFLLLSLLKMVTDYDAILNDDSINCVVELMGGVTDAKDVSAVEGICFGKKWIPLSDMSIKNEGVLTYCNESFFICYFFLIIYWPKWR